MDRLLVSVLLPFVLLFVVDQAKADTQQARDHWLQGRYSEAIDELKAESGATAATLKSRCFRSQGNLAEAERVLDELHANEQVTADSLAELASLQASQGKWDDANKLVNRALTLDDQQALARWLQAESFRQAGNYGEAETAYEWFIDHYNDTETFKNPESLYYVGQAAAQYARWTRNSGQFQFLVSELYPEVLRIEPNFWQAELAMSRMYAEKYNMALAAKHLNRAISINSNSSEILAHKAQIEVDSYRVDDALRTIALALKINPQDTALLKIQGLAKLTDFRAKQAIEILKQAAKINPRDAETQGYLACAYLAADGPEKNRQGELTRYGKQADQAKADFPNLGDYFAALGIGCDVVRKYPEAADFLRQSMQAAPQRIDVPSRLGMTLMRLGDEAAAMKILEEAFQADPFNVRVKNTLEVLDVLATYETIEGEHFIVRFDPSHDRLLANYLLQFLEGEVHPLVCEGLGYQPQEKTLIEIFNKAKNTSGHGWFSARMVGLPYVGTVGACAGKMVALASPNAVPEPFNWAHVIRHEFVHVVNLQQTNFNIPHWFTEALAVRYESEQRPPEWLPLLAKRLAEDRIFNLDTINYGFIRPADQDDWTMAYCQSFYYSEFIKQQFGEDALEKMLAAYRDYQTTDEIVKNIFQVEKADFEQQYRQYLENLVQGISVDSAGETFAQLIQNAEDKPEDPILQAKLAMAYLQRKSLPDARIAAQKALKLDAENPLANYVMGRLYLVIGDASKALDHLETAANSDTFERNAVATLAAFRIKQKRFDDALKLYQRGSENEPTSLEWQEAMLRIYLIRKDDTAIAKIIPRIAAQKHHDPKLRKKLAEILLAEEKWKEAATWAYDAIGIDVTDPQAHAILASAYEGDGRLEKAAQEFEVAGRLRPKEVSWSLKAAQLYEQLKQPNKVIAIARSVLEIAPQNEQAQTYLSQYEDIAQPQ